MNVAIIPARGGSKRIPKKNIREFAGKPIIAYSIEAALDSNVFDKVIVSTDSDEIAEVAVQAGADVPFRRPPELSDDQTATMPVLRHAIEWTRANVGAVGYTCCIYATAPFVKASDIRRGLQLLKRDGSAEFAFSVTTFAFPIFRALAIDGNRVKMFWPENELVRSQDLPEAYHDAGQFYWGSAQAFMTRSGFFSSASIPVVLPRSQVQDIDTLEDWLRAEQMFRSNLTIADDQ